MTHNGFEIKKNEYGWFNVPSINCFSSPTVNSAKMAIDSYVERRDQKVQEDVTRRVVMAEAKLMERKGCTLASAACMARNRAEAAGFKAADVEKLAWVVVNGFKGVKGNA